jgi:hypothetical protein
MNRVWTHIWVNRYHGEAPISSSWLKKRERFAVDKRIPVLKGKKGPPVGPTGFGVLPDDQDHSRLVNAGRHVPAALVLPVPRNRVIAPAALTLRGYAERVSRGFAVELRLSFLPWDQIACSPCCSIDTARRMPGYQPRSTCLEPVKKSTAALTERTSEGTGASATRRWPGATGSSARPAERNQSDMMTLMFQFRSSPEWTQPPLFRFCQSPSALAGPASAPRKVFPLPVSLTPIQ